MKKEKLLIRLMKKDDLNEVAILYANIYTQVDISEKWNEESSYKLMEYWLLKQGDLSFVALINNKIIGGFVAGIKPWWDGNHLVDGEIFVDYDYHKLGIGTKLSKIMYEAAFEKYNITSIDFVTFSKNGFPLSWYDSLGFEIEKELIMISGKPENVLKKIERKAN